MIYKFKDYEKSEILRDHLNLDGENPNGEWLARGNMQHKI